MSNDIKIVQQFITAGHFVQADPVKVAKCVSKQYLTIAISSTNNNMGSFTVGKVDRTLLSSVYTATSSLVGAYNFH